MTSLAYGLDMPYEVQLEHTSDPSNNHMVILGPQRSPGQPFTRHLLTPGVYMVSLSYNGAAAATLHHVGAGPDSRVSVSASTEGVPRTSAPMKISVQGADEYLYVVAPSTVRTARATISVIPASTFDEMAESTQGVSVLSEISTLKTTKADKSELESTNYYKGLAEDLNLLTSDNDFGMWRASSTSKNTPGAGFYHVLVYGAAGTTHRIQKAIRFGSQTIPSEHIRVHDTSANGVWGPWERIDIRTDTTVGTRVYAGNTMIFGDTGWRNLGQDDLINGWTFGTLKHIRLRRIGDMVFLNIPSFSLTGTEATGGAFMETPPGFSTYTGGNYGSLGYIGSSDGPVTVSKDFTRLSTPGRTALSGQLSWVTQSDWPTTLPGLPS